MKKTILPLLFCMVQGIGIFAQNLSPQVVAAGGVVNDSASTRLAYTVGQAVTGFGASPNTLLLQGFHQSSPNDSLPFYNIGEIPGQTVYVGIEQAFHFWSEELGIAAALSVEAQAPQPNGEIKFNPVSKRFAFKVASGDKNRYWIRFWGTLNQDTVWQDVPFDVIPSLPPEQTAFGLQPTIALPPDADDGNIIITETMGPVVSFNHKNIPTASISIAGKTLIFDPNLLNKLNIFCVSPREDVSELNLYAEKIIVRCGLQFKQTNVLIHARELIFEDDAQAAFISTTPANPPIDPIQGEGTDGLQAGSLTLHLEDFQSVPALRFRLVGGKGGGSSSGLSGGDGGDGGNFSANLDLRAFCDLAPGLQSDVGHPNGNNGSAGHFSQIPMKYSWLHPNALRLVTIHAKAAYLLGYNAYTQSVMDDYVEQIGRLQTLSEWENIAPEMQAELEQIRQEMATISQRIVGNMDYFGNPAGWVPMLSFEINKIAFEEEIDRAMRVLYFCYWVQKASAANEQKISALLEAKEQQADMLVQFQSSYTDAATLLPQLEAQANAIVSKMELLHQELQDLEQELTERAAYIVDSIHTPPKLKWWQKAAKIGGQILQVVPVFKPALAAIGKGLETLSGIDVSKPMEALSVAGDAIGQFSQADFSASIEQFKTQMNLLDFTTIGEPGSAANLIDYAKNLGNTAKPIVSKIIELRKAVGETSAPLEEIQVELDKIKAESPEYLDLMNQINDLMTQKAQFQQQITTALQTIATMGSNIQQGILTIDGINLQAFDANSKRNLRAMLYVKDMENRAKERLIKYHYYMAKAYEYRLLEAYPAELNLTEMFDDFRDMVEQEVEGTTVVLTNDEFQNLRGIYDDVLSSVTGEILALYNTNAPEFSGSHKFYLTQEDLDLLNSGHSTHLNMVQRGMFSPSAEDIRITKLEVVELVAHVENGQPGDFAYFDLNMEHSGISKLRRDGEVYLFNHYNNENTYPIAWKVGYDAVDGLVNPIEPSPSAASLLNSLLDGLGALTDENLVMYSRPAAWADIEITKTDVSSNGIKMVIDTLRLKATYDFRQLPSSLVTLEVATTDEMMPYICLSLADKNDRKDGWGNFLRTYFKNDIGAVQLIAPEDYGAWQFVNWTDQFGNELSPGNELIVNLGSNKFVKANYQLIQPILHVPQDTVYLSKLAGSDSIFIQNIGTGVMGWNCSGSAGWLSFASDSTGLNDGGVLIEFEENTTGVERSLKLVVLAPSSMDYLDTITIVQTLSIVLSDEQAESVEPLNVFPNPSTGKFSIAIPPSLAGGSLKVYNILGMTVAQTTIQERLITLDLSSLAKGLYFVEISREARKKAVRILLE
jgi:methyl-accepting chemotaxis protein